MNFLFMKDVCPGMAEWLSPARVEHESLVRSLIVGHLRIVHIKALARSYVWWPKMDFDIEPIIKMCELCQTTHHASAKVPLHL